MTEGEESPALRAALTYLDNVMARRADFAALREAALKIDMYELRGKIATLIDKAEREQQLYLGALAEISQLLERLRRGYDDEKEGR